MWAENVGQEHIQGNISKMIRIFLLVSKQLLRSHSSHPDLIVCSLLKNQINNIYNKNIR